VKECIQGTDYENIDIIGSNEELSFVTQSITFDQSRAQQAILKKCLKQVKDEYDYILTDNAPFYNILTINALTAADFVITPVQTNGFSYSGLQRLLSEIYKIKAEFNSDLEFAGTFITNANTQKTVFKDLYAEYEKALGDKFLKTYIRMDKNVDESNTAFLPLPCYNENSKAVHDYMKLLHELKLLDPRDQEILEKIRKVIKEAAPEAEEKISYQMPAFVLRGNLVYFAACKNHIGFYPTPSGINAFKNELSEYKGAKGSVQFPLNKPIPYELIRKIVKFRVVENIKKAEDKLNV
jgi:cellulose biosynthesis protein BcsQ